MRFGSMEAIANMGDVVDVQEISTIRNVLTLRPTCRGKIIGHDDAIRHVLATIDRVARSSCTVLVTGESGTGKELVVAALHDASSRREGPLVTINCGAIPLELVESELFGHARGAFTGAQQSRKGHFATAEGGTLFLDEIGELPMSVQVKLLRLLQQREYTPVGESKAIKCDVRIVAATNRDLEAEVAAGRFREDLYYRLNVIHLHLPPLRERRGDARLLAAHFFRNAVANSGRDDLRGLSDAALAAIEAHAWPGNIRALENAVERGVLLARGPWVEADDVIGKGMMRRAAVEAPVTVRDDARREPESSSDPMKSGAFRKATQVVPTVDDSARSAFAAVPPPAITEPRTTLPAVTLPSQQQNAGPVARPSDPMFPRVLPNQGVDLFSAVESYQNNLIRQALLRTGGNKNRAAQLLGVNRTTLVEMIRRRGL